MNNKPWNFFIKGKDWTVHSQQHQFMKLQASQLQQSGWYRIRLQTTGPMLTGPASVFLSQNNNPMTVELIRDAAGFSLVFFRHHPLNELTLYWQNQTGVAASFNIDICRISKLTALWQMLLAVHHYDKKRGQDPLRVIKKSYARWRKKGRSHSLQKLVQEYKPALTDQLVSCEPYFYWQQRIEPAYKIQLGNPTQNELCFLIRLDASGHELALIQTLQSVLQQQHPHWRLELITQQVLSAELTHLIAMDPRITTKPLTEQELHSYFCLQMKAGDRLADSAMHYWALAVQKQPETKILYTDHDELTSSGDRVKPQFKPQWNPDLLMSFNYIGPAVLYRSDLWKSIHSDHNERSPTSYITLLNAVAAIPKAERDNCITHQALVSYHQAQHNLINTLSATEQTQTIAALTRLFNIDQQPVQSISAGGTDGCFRVSYPLPEQPPLISLLIPTRDGLDVLKTCVDSILQKTNYPHYEILILDNQSIQSETLQWFSHISQNPKVRVLSYPYAFNFSAINNFGVSQAKGSMIALINNDVEVINAEWLTEMTSQALRPDIGAVGAKLYFFDNTIQHAGVVLGLWGLAGHSHKHYRREDAGYIRRLCCVQNYSAVTAACLVVSKDKYLQAGGLNEEHLTVAFNDVDFCIKLGELGYRNLWTPYAELYHYESKSRGPEDTPEKKQRERKEIAYMQQQWPHRLKQDPCYSPHLSHQREDFSIRLD